MSARNVETKVLRVGIVRDDKLVEERVVNPGDAIAIPPGVRHKLWNTGHDPLRLLCCCAPAYEHDDTIMTEPAPR